MEPAPAASLAHRRETYRLWFEYLKVAIASKRPDVVTALNRSAEFYAPWHMTQEVKFDIWWKTHRHLFGEEETVRQLLPDETPPTSDAIAIIVPLTQSPTVLTRQVKAIIQAAVAQRQMQSGRRGKKKRAPSARYRLSDGAEPKLLAVREMLTVYRDIHLANPKLRGKSLLAAVHAFYLGRKNKRYAKVPMPLMYVAEDDKIRAMRNLRRYIQKAEAVVLNVARGEFPGEY